MKTVIWIPLGLVLLSSSLSAQEEIFSEPGTFGNGAEPVGNRHVIQVEEGMSIEVVVISDDLDTTLNATLPSGETLYNDDYQELNAGFTRTIASSGALEVVASTLSGGESGAYRVVARTLPPPSQISLGHTIQARLGDNTGTGDRYTLNGKAGSRVVIDLRSYDFDAYLTVTEANGNELTDDDGGDAGYNSRIAYRFMSDETITIVASSLGSEAGRYELSVNELSDEVAFSAAGELTNNSPRGHDGTRYERHEFEGESGQMLTITLESADFDTQLFVSNPDGSNLARDDDGGQGNNSETVVTVAETGTHTIYVTGFGDGLGDYELTVLR